MTQHPPAWHPDPNGDPGLRWWDGTRWTEHFRPHQAPEQTPRPAPVIPPPPAAVPAPPTQRGPAAAPTKVPLFGARNVARQQSDELDFLRSELARLGALDVVELERQRVAKAQELEQLRIEANQVRTEVAVLRQQVVETHEEQLLQEAGVYSFHHPLDDSVAYKSAIEDLRVEIKAANRKDGGAIEAAQSWTVNGSVVEGRKMINDFSKLMLRAYNAEADNLVRGLKPYRVDSAKDRLEKVAFTIEKLGRTMSIRVTPAYHRLRIKELELTADYIEQLAREKEREREERERLREERKAQQEMERERQRLEKEQSHYANALAALEAKRDVEGAQRMRDQIAEIEKAIADVDYRAANARAGYVYVISNIGAFGDRMIKVGMTRRLEPMDRVRELGDASVPFAFDVHALFFAEDAVGIEHQMHQRLADKRVNRVNLRREFFYATPAEARNHLADLGGELLTFEESPEAIEFHQSKNIEPALSVV